MRTETDVQNRIRFLLSKELDRRVAEAQARLPHKCVHNHRQPLDVRKEITGDRNENYNRLDRKGLPVIGLCMLDAEDPTDWKGTICEDPIDAQRCPYFTSIETRETVEAKFNADLQDLGWVEINMPEVYGLLWALGSKTLPGIPFWKALWFRFLQIRPDALVKVPTPELPAGE